MVRSVVPQILVAALLACSVPAYAQSDEDKARANELASEAVQAFKSNDFVTAAERFADAHSYYPQSSLKLNEMVAWYKADDCTRAIDTARWIESNVDGLTSADEKDLDRVTSDCRYREANSKFEAGDLDGAAAILEQIDTEDGDVALKVGRLQGKIEERRKAPDNEGEGDLVGGGETEAPKAVEPPPTWWRPAGFAGVGVGLASAIGAVTILIIDQNRLNSWQEACDRPEPHPRCPSQGTLPPDIEKQAAGSQAFGGVLWAMTGVGIVGGGALLALHYLRQAKYDEYAAEQGMSSLQLVPVVSPDGAGITLHVRF